MDILGPSATVRATIWAVPVPVAIVIAVIVVAVVPAASTGTAVAAAAAATAAAATPGGTTIVAGTVVKIKKGCHSV